MNEIVRAAAIEVITITGQEAVWYFEEDADSLNIKMDDARINSGIFTVTPLHGTRGKVNLNLALFISDARELTENEKVKFEGYEVEAEPKYYIIDKNDEVLWYRDNKGIPTLSGSTLRSVLKSNSKDRYQFTEQEIKDYDERFWAFAVEVAE